MDITPRSMSGSRCGVIQLILTNQGSYFILRSFSSFFILRVRSNNYKLTRTAMTPTEITISSVKNDTNPVSPATLFSESTDNSESVTSFRFVKGVMFSTLSSIRG